MVKTFKAETTSEAFGHPVTVKVAGREFDDGTTVIDKVSIEKIPVDSVINCHSTPCVLPEGHTSASMVHVGPKGETWLSFD